MIFTNNGGDSLVSYEPLWRTLEEKGINQYRLVRYYNFSPGQLSRIKHGEHISTRTVDKLCAILDCQVDDIFEIIN